MVIPYVFPDQSSGTNVWLFIIIAIFFIKDLIVN